MIYDLLPSTLRLLLASLLWSPSPPNPRDNRLQFELRHEHALSNTSRIVFSDVPPSAQLALGSSSIRTKRTSVHKPVSQALSGVRFRSGDLTWDTTEVDGPDVQDREALLLLAKLANNAYTEPGAKDWYDIGPDWNNVSSPVTHVSRELLRRSRAIPSGGNPTRTGFAVMSSPPQTTQR